MLKVIGSAVVGYGVIFALVFGLMAAAWHVVGPEGAFLPGVWEVTGRWSAIMLCVALIAAVAGGYIAATISGNLRGPYVLIGIVVALGIIFALPALLDPGNLDPLPRPDELPMLEAMQNGRQPVWVALFNPVLGAVGVWLGMRIRARQLRL